MDADIDEVVKWFRARHIQLRLRPAGDGYEADLYSSQGTRLVARSYGSGPSASAAARRARDRFKVEED